MTSCATHPDQLAAGTCRSCGEEFCDHCLVYAFGEGTQPYCVDCAVSASTHRGWERRRRGSRTLVDSPAFSSSERDP